MVNNRPLITLEEQFGFEAARTHCSADDPLGTKIFLPRIATKLLDLGNVRFKDMDAGTVILQVISPCPTNGSAPIKICRKTNDELKKAVEGSKGRFAGFAIIPINNPTAAAKELERYIKVLGFMRALVNNHEKGQFYDDSFFWPIFSQCQELDVPIYLHLTVLSPEMAKGSGNYPDIVAQGLDTYC